MESLNEVQVDLDSVTVADQPIKRPDRISRSDWVRFWEDVKYKAESVTCTECGITEWIG